MYFPLSFRIRFTAIDSDQHILRPLEKMHLGLLLIFLSRLYSVCTISNNFYVTNNHYHILKIDDEVIRTNIRQTWQLPVHINLLFCAKLMFLWRNYCTSRKKITQTSSYKDSRNGEASQKQAIGVNSFKISTHFHINKHKRSCTRKNCVSNKAPIYIIFR